MASFYRVAGFIAILGMLLGAGYYAGLFAPETAGTTSQLEGSDAAAEEPTSKDANLTLRTAYLDQPIGKAHRVFLKWLPDGSGELLLDETPCTFNRFGQEKAASMAGEPLRVKFVAVPVKPDDSPDASVLFDVDGLNDTHLRVVKPRPRCPLYRLLVLDKDKNVTRVVTLERWEITGTRGPRQMTTAL
jgi:hypothetical protein